MNETLGHCSVDSSTVSVFTARVACTIQVWVVSRLYEDTRERASTQTQITLDRDKCMVHLGTPLPMDSPIDVEMQPGQTLYATTYSLSRIGYSVRIKEQASG